MARAVLERAETGSEPASHALIAAEIEARSGRRAAALAALERAESEGRRNQDGEVLLQVAAALADLGRDNRAARVTRAARTLAPGVVTEEPGSPAGEGAW